VAGAVFNATLSSLIGVFLTPLWIAFVLKTSGQTQPSGRHPRSAALARAAARVGQALHPWLGEFALRHKPKVNLVDRGTILLLVYTSFCDSFKQGIWTGHGAGQLWLVLAIALALFWLAMWVMSLASGALHFNREDKIAAMFCGSKKTLASGVPMAKLIFGAHPALA